MGHMSEQESRYTQTDGSLDELAKGLAGGTLSRGKALKMMGAALFGGAVASIPGAAWAACKQPFRKCTANSQCCSRQCIKNPQGNGKICGCPTGKTLCPAGNQCVTCNNTGEVVNLTTCKCECPSGTVLCNNACVSNVCDATTGEVFNPASCKCEAVVCDASTQDDFGCEGEPTCFCRPDIEGGYVCTESGLIDEFSGSVCRPYAYDGYEEYTILCNTNADCPPGGYCNPGGLCSMRCGSDRTCQ
jgi:hypothetical protein